jgi:5-methylcytosine-specific restriction endonuclease McrA
LSRSRNEFKKSTVRKALLRSGAIILPTGALDLSGAKCEAEGPRYGLLPGQRCNAPLSFGFQADHGNPDALSGDNSLENCFCVCMRCHQWKTRNVDVPQIAKAKRQGAKHHGPRRAKTRPMPFGRDSKFKRKVGGGVVPRF